MNKVFLVIVVLLISINAFSQSGKDVVHLKNGSVITGYIIEERPNVSVTLKSGENTFVFKIDEVEKITRQSLSKYEMKTAPLKIKCDYPNKGYRGFGELSFGKGVDKNDVKLPDNNFKFVHLNGLDKKMFENNKEKHVYPNGR